MMTAGTFDQKLLLVVGSCIVVPQINIFQRCQSSMARVFALHYTTSVFAVLMLVELVLQSTDTGTIAAPQH